MFEKEVKAELARVAESKGLAPACLIAIAEVESGGIPFTLVKGRREPLIRFEGHYFDRRLAGAARAQARRLGLASPVAGRIANPVGQAARFALLDRACAIDRKAALESVSWGVGQVMGAHWAWLGYSDVEALVGDARSGVAGQATLMLRFIDKSGLAPALARADWATFARGYNGPQHARHDYAGRLAAAYARHGGTAVVPAARSFRRGASGEGVAGLQRALRRHGHALAADGAFGAATEAALIDFQRKRGLVADGIAGPLTLAALDAPPPTPAAMATSVPWLARLALRVRRFLTGTG